MSLAAQEHALAALIWLVIVVGPPLVLVLLAPMFYADGAPRLYSTRTAPLGNGALLLLLIVGVAVWVLLLKYLYLPLIGFDTQFLTIGGFSHYNFTDLSTLRGLWSQTLDWIGRSPVSAVPLLLLPALLAAAVLFVARAQGRAASTPARPQTHSR